MLNRAHFNISRQRHREQGIVLLIAIIVLIALTLAGIGIIRSAYTTNIIAGNLAFRDSATSSADAGIEAAIVWLQSPTAGCTLTSNCFSAGYAASRTVKSQTDSWNTFWSALTTANQVKTLATDARTGNTVSYAIERLCNAVGPPQDSGCASSSTAATVDTNDKSNPDQIHALTKVFYRITSRVDGPRNTVSYVQAIVSM
jgi:type IV pilus assembly protein PilX